MKTESCKNGLMRSVLVACVLVASLGGARTALADGKLYQEALRSTTWVLAKNSDGTSSGTGVLVDFAQKLVMTNFHVVGDARAVVIFFPALDGDKPNVSRQYYLDNVKKLGIRGRVMGIDRKRDLALVQLERLPENAKAMELAPNSLAPGEAVESVGNPGSTEALWVYTSGTVRALYRKQFRTGAGEHDFRVLETQAPINSGDSGGPVMNSSGQLVAVAQAIAPNARLVSYNVDVSELKAFLKAPMKLAPLPATDSLNRVDLKYTQHTTGHFEVQLEQEDKSKQSVFITKDIEYYQNAEVRKIWSLALATKEPPSVETMTKLLQQSARTKLGAWTVELTAQNEFMIIYCVKMDATASPETVRSTMEYVANLTNSMKKELDPRAKAKPATQAQAASATLGDWLSNK